MKMISSGCNVTGSKYLGAVALTYCSALATCYSVLLCKLTFQVTVNHMVLICKLQTDNCVTCKSMQCCIVMTIKDGFRCFGVWCTKQNFYIQASMHN